MAHVQTHAQRVHRERSRVELFELGFVLQLLREMVLFENDIDERLQRLESVLVNEVVLCDEIVKVLEARVEMRLCIELDVLLDVRMVDMSVHSEQPLENGLYDGLEVFGEFVALLHREDLLIIDLIL